MSKQLNIEVKVKCEPSDGKRAMEWLRSCSDFNEIGNDFQTDVYFNSINETRIKVRHGRLENAIVSYDRQNVLGSKESSLHVLKFSSTKEAKELVELLAHSYGVKAIVQKSRHIFWSEILKVKVHVDYVINIGDFIEIEVMDFDGSRDVNDMKFICSYYLEKFGLENAETVAVSYSDMIMKGK